MGDWLGIAAQIIDYHKPRMTVLCDQPCEKALGSFGIPACRNEDVKRVAVDIHSMPEPMLHTVDRDDSFVQAPRVIRTGPGRGGCGQKSAPQSG